MISLKVNIISNKASQTNVEQIEIIKDLESNLNRTQVFTVNKEDKKEIIMTTKTYIVPCKNH